MDLSEHADSALLERYRAKRSEAEFAELVRRYRTLVLGTASRILANQADAEDAAQAAFVALALKTPRLRPGQSLGPWLHTVTVRAAFDFRKMARRRMSREGQVVQSLQASPPSPPSDIDAELEKLPKKLSATLVAHYLEGWSIDELARRESCATSTISMRLNRGRDQLRKRLGQDAPLSSLAAFTLVAQATDQGTAFAAATLKVISQALAGLRLTNPGILQIARHAVRPTFAGVSFPAVISAGACAAVALTFAFTVASPSVSARPDSGMERAGNLNAPTPETAPNRTARPRPADVAVTLKILIFKLPLEDGIEFLLSKNPVGNASPTLDFIEELSRSGKAEAFEEVILSGRSGYHLSKEVSGSRFDVETVVSNDQTTINIMGNFTVEGATMLGVQNVAFGNLLFHGAARSRDGGHLFLAYIIPFIE